jgi:ATP-dependent DNA helicase RecQ
LTYNALKVLDRNSVLALSEYSDRKSTVQFLVNKDNLFTYIQNHKPLSNLIKVILRTYGGIFEFETKVNTLLLSKKLDVKEEFVITGLEKLAKDEVIYYKGVHSDMELTFLVPREDELTINSFAKTIKKQNILKETQIREILSYINNPRTCRSIQLLSYFGEETNTACGICDVCLNKQEIKIENKTYKKVLSFLLKGAATSREIESHVQLENGVVLLLLKKLLEEGKISLNSRNQYEIQ